MTTDNQPTPVTSDGDDSAKALAALNNLAIAIMCDPSNETMSFVREIRAALASKLTMQVREVSREVADWQAVRDKAALNEIYERMPAIMNDLVEKRDAENDSLAQYLTDRFLAWQLPNDFSPDGGITYKKLDHPNYGTNLLTATQAKQMFLYLLRPYTTPKPTIQPPKADITDSEGV